MDQAEIPEEDGTFTTISLADDSGDSGSTLCDSNIDSELPVMNADMEVIDPESQVELEEKTRLINQVLELQHTLEGYLGRDPKHPGPWHLGDKLPSEFLSCVHRIACLHGHCHFPQLQIGKYDIVAITETWLKDACLWELNIQGYTVFRKDRQDGTVRFCRVTDLCVSDKNSKADY
ncbi:uncharacterized protein LOC132391675 isoform X2 [Hypanus sabinus]|uniref:uncharacterized protein LOC132391675 isoform X2 n=1 Tax=Hypanus sabinus TaxID=79690 RepID=UPI0028C510C9|nr:uncharacterized protein LOC132391675 isoform X2 [Hypanus sabinus]